MNFNKATAPGAQRRERSQRRSLRYYVAIAAIFFFLGLANILYGYLKHRDYAALLNEAILRLEQPVPAEQLIPPLGAAAGLQQTRYLRKLQSRLDFYSFVAQGGKWFLVFSGAVLLMAYVVSRPRD